MRISRWFSYLTIGSLTLGFANPNLQAKAITITDPNFGLFQLSGGEQLSGISYVNNNLFYAVSDSTNSFYPLNINLDLNTGQIQSATVNSVIGIATGSDHEGIAYNPLNNSVFIASENDSSIKEYSTNNGSELFTVNVLPVFQNIRSNRGLESLTRQADGTSLWTANEEALIFDGADGITQNVNTIVRLQKFDNNLDPVSQWAYPVKQPISPNNPFLPPVSGANGVSELLALPNGELLVLEREASTGFFPPNGFESRIYSVDFAGATDISTFIGGLDGEIFNTVTKTLLWDSRFFATNFEGITLGPQLDNGDYSLILVSDDGGDIQGQSPTNSLLTLRISGLAQAESVPEPPLIFALGIITSILALGKKK